MEQEQEQEQEQNDQCPLCARRYTRVHRAKRTCRTCHAEQCMICFQAHVNQQLHRQPIANNHAEHAVYVCYRCNTTANCSIM